MIGGQWFLACMEAVILLQGERKRCLS